MPGFISPKMLAIPNLVKRMIARSLTVGLGGAAGASPATVKDKVLLTKRLLNYAKEKGYTHIVTPHNKNVINLATLEKNPELKTITEKLLKAAPEEELIAIAKERMEPTSGYTWPLSSHSTLDAGYLAEARAELARLTGNKADLLNSKPLVINAMSPNTFNIIPHELGHHIYREKNPVLTQLADMLALESDSMFNSDLYTKFNRGSKLPRLAEEIGASILGPKELGYGEWSGGAKRGVVMQNIAGGLSYLSDII